MTVFKWSLHLCFLVPKLFSHSQCGGKKAGSFLFLFFFFVRCIFCQKWRTEKACESQERVIYGPLHATTTVVQQWYLGYSQKIPAYLLFAFVPHFIQHWRLSAACCIHQWSSWLIYKILAFFSQSIYSYKVAGVIAMSSDVYSAGFCKMKSKLTSAHVTVWIIRWMQCNMPCISFNGTKCCLAWVGTEWNINTSGFDPVALDDQQV